MKAKLILTVAIALLVAATPSLGQESVCALFSHLEDTDGQQVMITGDLIILKDLAVLGAADCDNRYVFREYVWPTALSLRPSPAVTPAQLQQFQNAGVEADRQRVGQQRRQDEQDRCDQQVGSQATRQGAGGRSTGRPRQDSPAHGADRLTSCGCPPCP